MDGWMGSNDCTESGPVTQVELGAPGAPVLLKRGGLEHNKIVNTVTTEIHIYLCEGAVFH